MKEITQMFLEVESPTLIKKAWCTKNDLNQFRKANEQ